MFHTSAPAPCTVNTPLAYDADPATAGLPTSESVHGDGSDDPAFVRVKLAKTAVDVMNWLCEVSAMPARRLPVIAGMDTLPPG